MKKNTLLLSFLGVCIAYFTLVFFQYTNAEAQIIIDPVTKTITITGINLSGTTNTGTTNNASLPATSQTVATTGTEFDKSLAWLFANNITKYDTASGFRQFDTLTREEAAKMMTQTYLTLGYVQQNQTGCSFTDIKTANPELSGYIVQACQLGLMKGAHGKFMPNQKLTRPESLAILIRMFEGVRSYESQNPRRSDYFLKGKALKLTSIDTQTAFDKDISRYEVALYIYRLQTIATSATLKINAQNIIQNLTGLATQKNPQTISTGTTTTSTGVSDDSSDLVKKLAAIATNISVEKDPELQEAISWMNDKGLTNFKTIQDYRPFEILTREQAAKMFVIFANIFNFSQDKITGALPTSCQFKDISKADPSLISSIENACKLEILQGGNQTFNPKSVMNKAQFIAGLIRLVEGKKLNETPNPRRTNYYQTALNIGIVGPADAVTFDNAITRYEVALFLYRFKVKQQMVNNINTDNLESMIITSVPGSLTTGASNIFIDTNLLQNGNFALGYMEIFGNKYKVVKTSTQTYFDKNFVRYGDLFDLQSDNKKGTISFILNNRYVLEGTIRINSGANYTISQSPDTTAYYKIKQQ